MTLIKRGVAENNGAAAADKTETAGSAGGRVQLQPPFKKPAPCFPAGRGNTGQKKETKTMPKEKGISTPLKCPICGAPWEIGATHPLRTDPGIIQRFYECGGHISLYPFPGGWRMDVYKCSKPTEEKTRQHKKKERWLFTDQEGGI